MPSLSKRPSGEAAVGELFELVDERAQSRVTIAPQRGALVTSFRVAGRELLYLDAATLNDATKNVRGGIPVLFPTPGKLADDRWQWGEESGALKQHGFARNFPFTVAKADPSRAELTLALASSAATLASYPWQFRFELTFQLEGPRLCIGSRVENRSARPLPCAVGYHPYFLVTDKSDVTIDIEGTRVFDNVTKRYAAFDGFDWSAPEVDVHVLDNSRPAAALDFGDGTRLALRGSADFTTWVVWALAGKDYICLEPWTAPGNALNTREHLSELPAGASHDSFVELEWMSVA
ncbi:MAG TPA: galactose mutarotase [Polyangiaceae bacterium]|nr:galactose mutarotase [Polyangiaceae bacterium]